MEGTPFEKAMIKNGVDEASVEGAKEIPYNIPNLLVDLHSPKTGIPVLWWRSVGHSHTAFVVEGFIDEVAHKAGKDPYQFRRALLAGHPRHLAVLDLAAEKAGWGRKLPAGRGQGIAVHESFNSVVAQVAEVWVDDKGKVHVRKVFCAIDCGRAVNPLTIEAQVESAIVFGLSAALHGAITLNNGRVEQGNFNDYPVLRMDEMPLVEVHIVPSTQPPTGVGEPGTPPIAPAVANAVFAASGVRVRRLPMGVIEVKKT
jgi:isoquinoline 1-oxidoreductase beta subunit